MILIEGMRIGSWGAMGVFGLIVEKGGVLFDLLVELVEV